MQKLNALNLKKKSDLYIQNILNKEKILALSIKSLIKHNDDYLRNSLYLLNKSLDDILQKNKITLSKSIDLLDSYSPLKTLQRGYVVTSQNNKIIKSIKDIDYLENLETRFVDGIITSKPIKEINYYKSSRK